MMKRKIGRRRVLGGAGSATALALSGGLLNTIVREHAGRLKSVDIRPLLWPGRIFQDCNVTRASGPCGRRDTLQSWLFIAARLARALLRQFLTGRPRIGLYYVLPSQVFVLRRGELSLRRFSPGSAADVGCRAAIVQQYTARSHRALHA